MILRHWFKFSLHTTGGVHESSIGMKVGRASSNPVFSPLRHFRFALPRLLSSSYSRPDVSTAIPGFANARRSYGNIVQLAEDPEEYGLYAEARRFARVQIHTRVRAP